MTNNEKLHILRENGTNGVHKAVAIESILGIPVINTPVGKIEPNHHVKPRILVREKYRALAEDFSGGICAVADLVTTINGKPSRKPDKQLAPHQIASNVVVKLETKKPYIEISEHATIAFGSSHSPQKKPIIGISTLRAKMPTKIVADVNFIQDMHEYSGLGLGVTQIPDAFELATSVAMLLGMKEYSDHRYTDFVTPPPNYDEYFEANPKYIDERIQLLEKLGRLQPIHQILPLPALIMIFDSALNAPGPMTKATWDKFRKSTP
jgi:hypothetical protein